eukprot:249221_1
MILLHIIHQNIMSNTQRHRNTCDDIESFQGAQFTIDIEAEAPELMTYFEGLKFTGTDSGAGAVITVNNKQTGGTLLNIERIECASMGACTGTPFIIGDDVSCDGCMVIVCEEKEDNKK